MQNASIGYVVIGGVTPKGADTDFFRQIVQHVQDRGYRVFFDFIKYLKPDEITTIVDARPYAIKCNAEEFARVSCIEERMLRKDPDLVRETASNWARDNEIEMALVSLGDKGGVLATRSGEAHYKEAQRITPVCSTGAGNSMMAALLDALSRGMEPQKALEYSVICGTLTCLKKGTDVAGPGDIERYLSKTGQ